MIIWTNNFAEKLFGFAMSREQLRETPLCGLLEDPNLQLDIDLAIDFNNAIRGDEQAAERFTNKFVLSSSYLDYSTIDFYTTRMETYPIFEYHVARIDYIFNNLDYVSNSNSSYNTSSTGNNEEDGFLDKLKAALQDCLNSPCNLFAASSESIASMIDEGAIGNTTTIPSFAELKGKFKNVYGGMKTTLTKRLPDAVSNMFSELAVVGKEAWSQSVDMLYEKDPEKRQKIIDNALGGNALDSDSTSYSYIPDLDALTSVSDMAETVLSQVASDLGGCYNKYQQLARYSPYDPEQNTSTTNKDPIVENVDGKPTVRNSFGVRPWDYKDRDLNVCKPSSNAKVSAPGSSTSIRGDGSGFNNLTADVQDAIQKGIIETYTKDGKVYVYQNSLRNYLRTRLEGSNLIGADITDAAALGITNTSDKEQWVDFFMKVAYQESTFQATAGPPNSSEESYGIYQLDRVDINNYTGYGNSISTGKIYVPEINVSAGVGLFEDKSLRKNPSTGKYEGTLANGPLGRGAGGKVSETTMNKIKNNQIDYSVAP